MSTAKVTRRELLRLAALGATAALAACAPKVQPTAAPKAAVKMEPAKPATAAPAPKAKGKIKFPYDEPPWWREQAKRFTEATGIEVDYEVVPFTHLQTRYQTALVAGTPDFSVMHVHDGWKEEWGTKGMLKPLESWLTDDMRQDYPPKVLDLMTATDIADKKPHLYGLPLYYWLTSLYYRTDVFTEKGIKEPPKTVEEMRRVAKQVQQGELSGCILALSGSGPTTAFGIVLRGEGGDILVNGQPGFNTTAGQKALGHLVGMAQDKTLSPSSFEAPSSTAMVDIFTQGRAAMTWGPPPTLVMAAAADKSKVVGKVAVALMPGGSVYPSATTHETGSRAIPYNAPNPEAAWEYIKFVTSPEEMVKMAIDLGRIPARISALADKRVQDAYPLARIVGKQLEYPSGMMAVHARGTEISKAVALQLTAALRLEKTPEAALAQAEKDVLTILKG